MVNKRKLRKLIYNPKLYFIDAYKNKFKQFIKFLKKHESFLEKNLHHVDKLVDINIPITRYYSMLHGIFKEMNYRSGADKAIKKAIGLKPKANSYYQHAIFLKSRGLTWQAVEALSKAIDHSTIDNIDIYREYAYTLETMNRIEDSITAWGKVESLGKLSSYQYYRYGYVLEQNDQKNEAQKKYNKAIKLDKTDNSKELGIGIFHEKREYWLPASEAYKLTSQENFTNAVIHYKLAHSLERCYRWVEAESEYLLALTFKPEKIDSTNNCDTLGFRFKEDDSVVIKYLDLESSNINSNRLLG